ncbi:MAG: S1 family peptidase [Terriglobia bacterium]
MDYALNKLWGTVLVAAVMVCLLNAVPAGAQVTSNILLRVFMIDVGRDQGTAFTVEHGGQQYLVTAKHIMAALPERTGTIHLFQNRRWRDLAVKVIQVANPTVDIAVLKIPHPLSPEYPIRATMKGTMLGGKVYFFGYPYGLTTIVNSDGYPLPLVKHGIVSGFGGNGGILYVDGFNNPGFSGGPIVTYEHFPGVPTVVAVIHGYLGTHEQAQLGHNITPLTVAINTGILVGYSIDYAIDAIEESERKVSAGSAPERTLTAPDTASR